MALLWDGEGGKGDVFLITLIAAHHKSDNEATINFLKSQITNVMVSK